jgi:hypothetical protein
VPSGERPSMRVTQRSFSAFSLWGPPQSTRRPQQRRECVVGLLLRSQNTKASTDPGPCTGPPHLLLLGWCSSFLALRALPLFGWISLRFFGSSFLSPPCQDEARRRRRRNAQQRPARGDNKRHCSWVVTRNRGGRLPAYLPCLPLFAVGTTRPRGPDTIEREAPPWRPTATLR